MFRKSENPIRLYIWNKICLKKDKETQGSLSFLFVFFSSAKSSNYRHNKHDQNDHGQNKRHIGADPSGEGDAALSAVGFRFKILPSPAIARCAKQNVCQAPDRQQKVGNKKVFQIHKILTKNCDVAPNVQAEYAGEREQGDERDIDKGYRAAR